MKCETAGTVVKHFTLRPVFFVIILLTILVYFISRAATRWCQQSAIHNFA